MVFISVYREKRNRFYQKIKKSSVYWGESWINSLLEQKSITERNGERGGGKGRWIER